MDIPCFFFSLEGFNHMLLKLMVVQICFIWSVIIDSRRMTGHWTEVMGVDLQIGLGSSYLSHSTPSTSYLCQRDLIPWSAHETALTWVCNFRDLTRHNSDCNVTVIYRWRTLFNCEREESTWSHDFLNGVYLWFFCLHFSFLQILLILSSFFPFCNN